MEMSMMVKEFEAPWLVKHTVVCPRCGLREETFALWPWEKEPDKIGLLQLRFCHWLDPEFLELIPVLTENDLNSNKRMDEFREYFRETWNSRSEAGQMLFSIPEAFRKYGVIALIFLRGPIVRDMDLKAISLFLCLEKNALTQVALMGMLNVSRSYASTILKRLLSWRFISAYKLKVKGRAHGRKLAYVMDDEVRGLLEKDLAEHDFFRQAVVQVVRPIAEAFSGVAWRKDILWPDRVNIAGQ
jgi:predicted transcriptional regulator